MKAGKKAPRTVFGRLKGIDVAGGLWIFTMTKSGVTARKRNSRKNKALLIGFDKLANSGGVIQEVRGQKYRLTFTDAGLEIIHLQGKTSGLLTWVQLLNLSKLQPELFPAAEMDGKIKEAFTL